MSWLPLSCPGFISKLHMFVIVPLFFVMEGFWARHRLASSWQCQPVRMWHNPAAAFPSIAHQLGKPAAAIYHIHYCDWHMPCFFNVYKARTLQVGNDVHAGVGLLFFQYVLIEGLDVEQRFSPGAQRHGKGPSKKIQMPGFSMNISICPSILYTCFIQLRVAGSWSQSQPTLGEGQDARWTGCQSLEHRQTTHKDITSGSLWTPINLTSHVFGFVRKFV